MDSFLQPPPEVVAFLALKKFVYLEVVVLLALMRSLAARGAARWTALLALVIAAVGIAAQFGPAVTGLYSGPVYRASATAVNAGTGLALPLAASAALALSAVVPGRRWWGIDAVHALLVAALLVLWTLGG